MEGHPTGTVSFLFTDIEGSTALWERDPKVMAAALETHDGVMAAAIGRNEGYVFSRAGDSFGAAFATPSAALAAASQAQEELKRVEWPPAAALRVRMAVHVGTAVERGGDYYGPTLNRAARIMGAAHGGQVLLSAAAAAILRGQDLVDLGEHRLADLVAPERIFQLGGDPFPPLRTLDRVAHNLPAPRTPLFGRDDDAARVARRLLANRLVTITGVGGAGKTRLAVAAASSIVDRFPDGVWFVDLVAVDEGSWVPAAVAAAMGLRLSAAVDPLESLVGVLRRRFVLVVLDNCEHLIGAAAELVDTLLDRSEAVRILVTSREPLDIAGEHLEPIGPLPVLEGASGPAVELFAASAARAGSGLPEDDRPLAAEICRHLDGLPLAIELAAAQTAHLSARQILDRLDARFEFLDVPSRGRGGARHARLETVMRDTWNLLPGEDRTLLSALAAFPAEISIDGAEYVARARGLVRPASTLRNLAHRSVLAPSSRGAEPTYRLLESVKLFARRRWAGGGQQERDLHLAWVEAATTRRPIDEQLTSLHLSVWCARHDDDIRAAVTHALATDRAELAARLLVAGTYRFRLFSGPPARRALDDLRAVAARTLPAGLLAHVHLATALAALGANDQPLMDSSAAQAAEVARIAAAPEVEVMALIVRSWLPALRAPDEALTLLTEAGSIAQRIASTPLFHAVRANIGTCQAVSGRLDEALATASDVLRSVADFDYAAINAGIISSTVHAFRAPGDARAALQAVYEGMARSGLPVNAGNEILAAAIAATSGDLSESLSRLEHAAAVCRRTGEPLLPDALVGLAVAAWTTGRRELAASMLATVRSDTRPTGSFPMTIIYRELRRRLHGTDPDAIDPADVAYARALRWLTDEAYSKSKMLRAGIGDALGDRVGRSV